MSACARMTRSAGGGLGQHRLGGLLGLCGGALAQQPAEVRRRQRARDVEALREVAAELAQARPRLVALDALGDDPQAEVVREVDRGAHDRGVGGVDAPCPSRTTCRS